MSEGIRLLTKPEVLDRTSVSYVTLWKWMIEGKFPRARELCGQPRWVASEVEKFLAELPIRPIKGEKGAGLAHEPYKVKNNLRRLGKKNKRRAARGEQRAEA